MSVEFDFSQPKDHKTYHILKPLAALVNRICHPCTYVGKENIPKEGGFIICCNHMSNFDPIVLGSGVKRPVHYMAKEELFENKALGWFLGKLNAFPVIRGKGDMRAVEYAEKIIKKGYVLGIFPEGTRSKEYKPMRGKAGAALIAKQTGADVLPVSIYTEDKYKNGTHLTIRFGKLIKNSEFGFTEEGKSRELKDATHRIMGDITALWEEGHCKK